MDDELGLPFALTKCLCGHDAFEHAIGFDIDKAVEVYGVMCGGVVLGRCEVEDCMCGKFHPAKES